MRKNKMKKYFYQLQLVKNMKYFYQLQLVKDMIYL